MPNITDYFAKAADDSKDFPVVATVTEARATKGDTLKLNSLAGWSTTTPVHFMSYSKNDKGMIDLASQADWKGLVVDNTITQLTLTRGVDKGHKVGDQIVLNPTAGWLDDLMSGLGVSLNPDGTLKDGIVKTSNVDWASVSPFDLFHIKTLQELGSLDGASKTIITNMMVMEQAYTLRDSRDGTSYTIAKLKTGDVMMCSDLMLTNFKCTPEDTDITEGSFLVPASTDGKYPAGQAANAVLLRKTEDTCFYSWSAATAGVAPNIGQAKTSIMPKGWTLPTRDEWKEFIKFYSTNPALDVQSVPGCKRVGFWNASGIANANNCVYYWASTVTAANQPDLLLSANSSGNILVRPQTAIGNGFAIRGILRKPEE